MGTLIRLDDYPVWPVLPLLLKDRTMKRNIIWATASYASLGEYYADSAQMTENALRNMGRDSIQPRILKAQEEQQKRTRAHAEVFTPAWICCQMNNHLDEEWFGRKDVFNVQRDREWTPTEGHITFPKHKHASWKLYVDSRRLEITCGEAPFIVSRYDASTGEEIPIERRIGLLDRKLRIVGEYANGEQEWVKWAIRAIQSVYGPKVWHSTDHYRTVIWRCNGKYSTSESKREPCRCPHIREDELIQRFQTVIERVLMRKPVVLTACQEAIHSLLEWDETELERLRQQADRLAGKVRNLIAIKAHAHGDHEAFEQDYKLYGR